MDLSFESPITVSLKEFESSQRTRLTCLEERLVLMRTEKQLCEKEGKQLAQTVESLQEELHSLKKERQFLLDRVEQEESKWKAQLTGLQREGTPWIRGVNSRPGKERLEAQSELIKCLCAQQQQKLQELENEKQVH